MLREPVTVSQLVFCHCCPCLWVVLLWLAGCPTTAHSKASTRKGKEAWRNSPTINVSVLEEENVVGLVRWLKIVRFPLIWSYPKSDYVDFKYPVIRLIRYSDIQSVRTLGKSQRFLGHRDLEVWKPLIKQPNQPHPAERENCINPFPFRVNIFSYWGMQEEVDFCKIPLSKFAIIIWIDKGNNYTTVSYSWQTLDFDLQN